jgi:hypothetical protein
VTLKTQDVEAAVRFVIDRTAEGEPLWTRGADGEPALMAQDHRALRRADRWRYYEMMRDRVSWRRGTAPTPFSRKVAGRLAERYPERELGGVR